MWRVKELPVASEVDPETSTYDLRTLEAPVLSGLPLSLFIKAYESLGNAIYGPMSLASGIHQVLHQTVVPEQPQFLPSLPVRELGDEPGCVPVDGEPEQQVQALQKLWPELAPTAPTSAADVQLSLTDDAAASSPSQPPQPDNQAQSEVQYRRPKIADYVAAYRSGKVTPVDVAERVIKAIALAKEKGYAWFTQSSEEQIREQAKASAERWAAGKPLSCLDGVPFAVKDVMAAEPYQTTVGTSFAAEKWRSYGNAPYVTALKSMGAVLLGKNTMHEIGMGVTGLNPRTGTALNPNNLNYHTGGSSSGSAAVVAAGLCPFTIGGDGGGSIRVPSSFCGIVGLKPTNGRVTSAGCFQVDCTVAVLGPLAASVQDAAVLYTVLANHDAWYTHAGEKMPTARVPKSLGSPEPTPLSGHTAGIYWEWFRDASPDVVAACTAAVALLEVAGVKVSGIKSIPELELVRVAHNVTIVSEMMSAFQSIWEDPQQRALFSPDVRIGFDSSRHWTSADYLQAQKIRARATVHFRRAMKDVDVLITPSTPITAPPLPSASALKSGQSNLKLTSQIMRYAPPANFLGLPSIAVPVGKDSKGLPISLQIMGKPWHEATLIKLAAQLERALQVKAKSAGDSAPITGVPQVWIDPITGQSAGLA